MKKPLSNKQRRAARKAFPKQARNERPFTYDDYLRLSKGGTNA
jgi:hypothetical protein